ncbi:MAG: TonB-dependent receptor [Pseudomonadota bacterium]
MPNFPLTDINSPVGAAGNASDGFFSQPGPFPADTIFRNDVRRTDEQFGLFGEASFDVVPELLTITAGLRYYDVTVDLEGSANGSFFNRTSPVFGPNFGLPPEERQDTQLGGTNISALYAPDNPNGNPDTASTSGTIFKGTATLTPTEDLLFYVTYSEGFRPGLLNRPGGAVGPTGFVVPFELETDEVKNYEFGWKTEFLDGQVRLNGSAFFVDISNLQTSIFDPSITNLFFADNAANAEIYGIEADFVIAPYSLPGFTVAGAFSILDTEITEVLTPTDDVIVGSELAYAPAFQGNIRARYEWDLNSTLEAFVQPQFTYSAEKFTDIVQINNIELADYFLADLSVGVRGEQWKVEIFGENLTDERAQISGVYGNDRERIVVNRPLTVGVRVGFDY